MNHSVILIILIVIAADAAWVLGSRIYFKRHPQLPENSIQPVLIRGRFSPGLTFARLSLWKLRHQPGKVVRTLRHFLEALLVVAWAFWAGRSMLNFVSHWLPAGIDFPLAVRDNYFWPNLFRCGACALWNGNFDGGYPALLDLLGAPLHPIVALPSVALGVINGGKLTVVLALALAGLAQLWIGASLGFSRSARLWGALMAVVTGSITGRMEIGQVTLLVSTASGMLWIAALLHLYQHRTNRSAVFLALASGLLLISGQGYIQIAVALAFVPAALYLFLAPSPERSEWLEKMQVAGVLGLLSAGILVVPLLNNFAILSKDTNLGYTSILPLGFQLVSLVHPDQPLTQQQLVWGWGMLFQSHNYLGPGPVMLAALAPLMAPKKNYRLLGFLLLSIPLVYLCSTMVTPRLLFDWIDVKIAAGIRHPGVMAGMVGPSILALAAWSIDRLERLFTSSARWFVRFSGRLLLIALAAMSLVMVYVSSQRWLGLQSFQLEESLVASVDPSRPQWVAMPDEHYWNVLAFERGMKLTGTFHPWHFAQKMPPPPALVVSRDPPLADDAPLTSRVLGLYISRFPEVHYAYVQTGGALLDCPALATGGLIRVTCETPVEGTLVVMEHTWAGWVVEVDSAPAALQPGEWLAVNLKKGAHSIIFRYLPWDVPAGMGVSLLGLGALVWWWKTRKW